MVRFLWFVFLFAMAAYGLFTDNLVMVNYSGFMLVFAGIILVGEVIQKK